MLDYIYKAHIFNSNIVNILQNSTQTMNTRSRTNKKQTKENPNRHRMRPRSNTQDQSSQRNIQSQNMDEEQQSKLKRQKIQEKKKQKKKKKKLREQKPKKEKEKQDQENMQQSEYLDNYDSTLKHEIMEQVQIIKHSWYLRMVLCKFLKGRDNKQRFKNNETDKQKIQITQKLIQQKLQEISRNFVDYPDKNQEGQTDTSDPSKSFPIFINTLQGQLNDGGWLMEHYLFGGRVDYFVESDYQKVKKLLQLSQNPYPEEQNQDCQGNEKKCENFVIDDKRIEEEINSSQKNQGSQQEKIEQVKKEETLSLEQIKNMIKQCRNSAAENQILSIMSLTCAEKAETKMDKIKVIWKQKQRLVQCARCTYTD